METHSLLLVDADERSLQVLQVSLRKAGFEVRVARDGHEALAHVQARLPDLVISDVEMPKMDGFAFCDALKRDANACDIPFIFLTAHAAIEQKIRGLELGVEDYLTKPIYIKEILTRVRMLLRKRQRARIAKAPDARTRFAGSLEDLGVPDLIQTIELSRKSGLLLVTSESGSRATVFFRGGKVIDSELGHLQGEEGFYRLLTWSQGEFELVFRQVRRNDVIAASSQGLLMEGMRRLDERLRLLAQLPPLAARFVVEPTKLAEQLPELRDELNGLIKLFDGRRTIAEVVDDGRCGELESLTAIAELFASGLLVPEQGHDAELSNSPQSDGESKISPLDSASTQPPLVEVQASGAESPPSASMAADGGSSPAATDVAVAPDSPSMGEAKDRADPVPAVGRVMLRRLRLPRITDVEERLSRAATGDARREQDPRSEEPAAEAREEGATADVALEAEGTRDPRSSATEGGGGIFSATNATDAEASSAEVEDEAESPVQEDRCESNPGIAITIDFDDEYAGDATPLPIPETDDGVVLEEHRPARMISSAGADMASVSGEVSLRREEPRASTARELVTIAPLRGRSHAGMRKVVVDDLDDSEDDSWDGDTPTSEIIPVLPEELDDEHGQAVSQRQQEHERTQSRVAVELDALTFDEIARPQRWRRSALVAAGAAALLAAIVMVRAAAQLGSDGSEASGGEALTGSSEPVQTASTGHDAVAPAGIEPAQRADSKALVFDAAAADRSALTGSSGAPTPSPAAAAESSSTPSAAPVATIQPSGQERYRRARVAVDRGDYDRALEEIDASLAAGRSARALGLRAEILWELGNVDEALAAATTAVSENPRDADAWLTKGGLHWEREEQGAAESAYRRYLALRPRGVRAEQIRRLLGVD